MKADQKVKKTIYKGDLVLFSIIGAIPISLSLLMICYFFLSENSEPPFLFKIIFELMLSGRFSPLSWYQVNSESLMWGAGLWILVGMLSICFGIYKYWKLKKLNSNIN